MIDGKYVIGICLTRVFEVHTKRYLESLHRLAKKEGVKIMVFHSLQDFFYDSIGEKGAASVFSLINYDIVDALVIMPETIKNAGIVDQILAEARKHYVPVISVDREMAVDVCIMPEQSEAFTDLVQHLIKVHKIKRPYLMSGRKDELDSEKREKAYCKILEENGIDVDAENYIGYGEYWSEPTRRALDKLFSSGIRLPDAIVCSNDAMAIETIDYLRRKNISVPEDMIVTGYDGIDHQDLMVPALTTCENDYDTYAEHTIDSALRLIEGQKAYSMWYVPLKLKLTESCGCCKKDIKRYEENAGRLYNMVSHIDHVDAHWFSLPARFMDSISVMNLKKTLFRYMPERSAVCFNSDFVDENTQQVSSAHTSNHFTETMTVLAAKGEDSKELSISEFKVKDILPTSGEYVWGDTVILTSIHSEGNVYGYLAVDLDEFTESSRTIHKFIMTLNTSIGLMDASLRTSSLKNTIEKLSLVDVTTGLYSYKGLHEKCKELYKDDPERKKIKLVVSIYSIRNWLELIREYGIEETEYALDTVKEALRAANPRDTIIGRYSDGDFILVNIFSPDDNISDYINKSVRSFYDDMERINAEHTKAYYLEVNAGCTTVETGWEGTFSDLVKVAYNELIVNRLRNNVTEVEKKDGKVTDEMLKKFIKLVDENLFFYNFQPIVDAKTGEIYAYEALMRTPPEIGLFPDQILDIAAQTGRLYDIERATIFNVFCNYYDRRDQFKNRKVFINSIPGYMLSPKDFKTLRDKYHNEDDRIVIEITEQFSSTEKQMDEFLNAIKEQNWQYAIDDYGAGNSNIVNLLRFSPNLIKIDRFLITDIEKDVNKQMFVKNIIEFAKNNNIKILAEGVETLAELETVIGFGIDLIQGYYTARPDREVLDTIPSNIRKDIISATEGKEAAVLE